MQHAALDNLLWVAGLVEEVALSAILFGRGRWRQFPAFTALISSDAAFTLLFMPINRFAGPVWYTRVYLFYEVVNFLLQLAVVAELVWIVLRPTGTWVQDARKQFIGSGIAGGAVALVLAHLVAPPASSLREGLELRASLFTSLLICELVIAATLASNRLGLGWKSHVMAIGQGLAAWSTVAVIIDSLHSFYGTHRFYTTPEHFKLVTYLAALGYWCVQLWANEPARQPISPQLRKYILALHQRVQYDLGKAEH